MLSNYRLDKIEDLLRDFNKATGQRIGLFDSDFNEVFICPWEHCEFCTLMRSTKKGTERCLECDFTGMKESKKEGKLIMYRCHAGLIETCAPIIDDDEILGYILFGQLYYNNNYEEQCANTEMLVADLVDDVAALRNAIAKIRTNDKAYLTASANIMVACIRYIIYEQMLKFEKQDLWFKINNYIKNNYDKALTLDKIADAFSISVPALCKTVKNKTGKTVGQLICERRIEKSKYYLSSTKMPVSEVSRLVGIGDYNYFSRMFKKNTGYSPLVWRKLNSETVI